MHEAMYWTQVEDGAIECELCPHRCRISAGMRGGCHVRENRGGVLYSLNYRKLVAGSIDPVEKKPLFHYCPGSTSFSIAAAGCNMHCKHCQNASISQVDKDVPGEDVAPERIVAAAQQNGCRSIAYTYTEPTIYYETMLETARLAQQVGLGNVMVSNGYMEKRPFMELAPLIQGANIDLKSFDNSIYRNLCGARLAPVLKSLERFRAAGIWLEVTTLIIPGYNDDAAQLNAIAGYIVNELGADVPWHVSAFYPAYRLMDVPPTPIATIKRAYETGKAAGLDYVYVGNVVGENEDTVCPGCGAGVIERRGYNVTALKMERGVCESCGMQIPGVWE